MEMSDRTFMLQIFNNLMSSYVLKACAIEKQLKNSDNLLTVGAICDELGVQ